MLSTPLKAPDARLGVAIPHFNVRRCRPPVYHTRMPGALPSALRPEGCKGQLLLPETSMPPQLASPCTQRSVSMYQNASTSCSTNTHARTFASPTLLSASATNKENGGPALPCRGCSCYSQIAHPSCLIPFESRAMCCGAKPPASSLWCTLVVIAVHSASSWKKTAAAHKIVLLLSTPIAHPSRRVVAVWYNGHNCRAGGAAYSPSRRRRCCCC